MTMFVNKIYRATRRMEISLPLSLYHLGSQGFCTPPTFDGDFQAHLQNPNAGHDEPIFP
ncbi:hypothetical protein QJS10_CPB11g01029 [Acorus calamus]|uniref:Uncharacterized protein n=1 Tax=Acorus calamus TaxID=4465 RepID=A0AAV9DVJ5_ACOCL|nr:hypothetical protein QJS10_CPB11g01029 [Acorus calamus]